MESESNCSLAVVKQTGLGVRDDEQRPQWDSPSGTAALRG